MSAGVREIDGLELGEEVGSEFFATKTGSPLKQLRGLANINVFVGANSSGKSRLMRHMVRTKNWTISLLSDEDEDKLDAQLNAALEDFRRQLNNHHLQMWGPINADEVATPPSDPWFEATDAPFVPLRGLLKSMVDDNESGHYSRRGADQKTYNNHGDCGSIERSRHKAKEALESIMSKLPSIGLATPPRHIYIPVLRGLRSVYGSQTGEGFEDLYGIKTRRDYDMSSGYVEVSTGAPLFKDIRSLLLGSKAERKLIKDYEDFLSNTFFDGQEVTLTPHEDRDVLTILIGEEEHAIHDVGDGLQTVIILTFESFKRREEECFFFIEEPELYLHPGFERRLIEFFDQQTNHVFFLTTHSNHLLDMSLDYDMSIYNFRPTAAEDGARKFIVQQVNRGDRSSLELLGVRNSSVFLVNATIWVEGVTERRYLREYLHMYREHLGEGADKLAEDLHYSFVEYAGSNITHWSFLDSEDAPIQVKTLCGHAFVIADQDDSAEDPDGAKAQRYEFLENHLGDRFALTPGREIENTLPWSVIQRIVDQYEGQGESYCPEAERKAYRDQGLGLLIEELLQSEKGGKKRRGRYAADSGTLASKTEFCRRACELLRDCRFEDLDAEVQAFVKRIYEFVEGQHE